MAYEKIIQEDTFPIAAGQDLSQAQYKLVSLDAGSGLVLASPTSPILFALLDFPRPFYGPGPAPLPNQAQSLSVVLNGIAKVKLGGPVTPGDDLASDAGGLAVKWTAGSKAGKALYAGVAGDIIPMFVAVQ